MTDWKRPTKVILNLTYWEELEGEGDGLQKLAHRLFMECHLQPRVLS